MQNKSEQTTSRYVLRDYQTACTKITLLWLKNQPKKHGLVVMPTGSGKSLVIADIIKQVLVRWDIKILLLSHVKEILVQDKEKLNQWVPEVNTEFYSASLGPKRRGTVTLGSIQTVVNNIDEFQDVKLIIVDEAHSISEDGIGSYNKVFQGIPHARILGYTATPFRYRGYLTDVDHIFHDIVYEVYISTLIRKGYLSKIYTKATKINIDTSKLKVVAGDYSKKSLSTEVDQYHLTSKICENLVQFKESRKHWLVACVSIDHAIHVSEQLNSKGIVTMAVHSKMKTWERDLVIRLYTTGKLQAVTQVNILSVGFDYPGIDLIVLLRPTRSYVIHVQLPGRGFRIEEGKKDCMILDYAGNFKRLGPLDARPHFPKKNKKGVGGVPLMKECAKCNELVPIAVKVCSVCDYVFPVQEKLKIAAVAAPVLVEQMDLQTPTPNKYTITGVFYGKYKKEGKPATLKVTYKVPGLKRFPEWIGLESPYKGIKTQAHNWWKVRSLSIVVPQTVNDAMEVVKQLKTPTTIEVDETNKFPKITKYYFN